MCGWSFGADDGFGFAEFFRAAEGFLFFVFAGGAAFLQFSQSSGDFPLRCSVFDVGCSMFPNPFRPPRHRLFDDFADLRDLVNAHERVHFGQELRQFIAETLRAGSRKR